MAAAPQGVQNPAYKLGQIKKQRNSRSLLFLRSAGALRIDINPLREFSIYACGVRYVTDGKGPSVTRYAHCVSEIYIISKPTARAVISSLSQDKHIELSCAKHIDIKKVEKAKAISTFFH